MRGKSYRPLSPPRMMPSPPAPRMPRRPARARRPAFARPDGSPPGGRHSRREPAFRARAAAAGWLALLACCLGFFPAARLEAQTPEERAFEALQKMFQDRLYEHVARDAASFTAQFTNSAHAIEVVLIQAQAALALGQYESVNTLLETHQAAAGSRGDEFAYWRAQAAYRSQQMPAAAEAFARLQTDFPTSPRRIEAAVLEALSRFRSGDAARAVALLRDPAGHFQSAAQLDRANPWSAQGWLLLAQLSIDVGDPAGAEQALGQLGTEPLSPAMAWERNLLLARASLAASNLPQALIHTTNLWTDATNVVSRELLAQGAALQGIILEASQQTEAAIQAYTRNLATNAPPDQRRYAMEKVIALSQQQGPAVAAARLQAIIDARPEDDLVDLARFALGEARLAEYQTLGSPGAPATPETATRRAAALTQARTQFEWLLQHRPESPLAGRAELNRAWSLWEEGLPRLADAMAAFRSATDRLAPSLDRANARLKWADCQARLGDLPGALTNYWLVATGHVDTAMPDSLRGQALSQIVHTCIQSGDLGVASSALTPLARVDAGGELAQRAELALAEAFTRRGQPEPARAQYEAFLHRYTNSVLIPEVRLAIGRTFEQRGDNGAALSAYTTWLAEYTNQVTIPSNLVARALFDLARVAYRSSPDDAAVSLLTNFIARFPKDPHAALAQYLVADHAFSQSDYARAELLFLDKLLEPSPANPADELPYRARLMAGKAAVFRQGWQNAREHFDWIITNGPLYAVSSPIPPAVVAEAYMARGDLFILEPRDRASDPLAGYTEATNAFAKVALQFPQTEWAPRAWGRIGDCNLQLATVDPKHYEVAAEAYQKVVASPADPAVRSMAEVGLGLVREKQAVLEPKEKQKPLHEAALDHYLNVFYEKNLRPNEVADPAWLKQAGLYAVKLAESLQQWDVARGLYQRLAIELPPLRKRFEKRVEQLRDMAGPPKPQAP